MRNCYLQEQSQGKPAGGERTRQLIACFSPAGCSIHVSQPFPPLIGVSRGQHHATRSSLLPTRRSGQSSALPHTSHPTAQLFGQVPQEALRGWAPRFPLGRSLITSSTRPGCGRGIRPDLLPAQPPRLPDAIYQADICLQRSARLCSSMQAPCSQHSTAGEVFPHSQLCCFGGKLQLRDVRLLWGMRW